MELKKITLLVLLFVNFSFANTIFNDLIVLPKENKIKKTFSGDISDTISFHLIFTKNKKSKMYEIFTYFFDGKSISKLEVITTKKKHNIVSFHQNNGFLFLLLSYETEYETEYEIGSDNFLKRIKIDLKATKIVDISEFSHNNYSSSLRKREKTIFIYKDNLKLKVKVFDGKNKPLEKVVEFLNNDEIKDYFKGSFSPIERDRFVISGSSAKSMYYIDNKLVFVYNNIKKKQTTILLLNLNEAVLKPVFKTFGIYSQKKLKKYTTYVYNNKLFMFGLSKKIGVIKIVNIYKESFFKEIIVNNSLVYKIKGAKKFSSVAKFLRKAGGSRAYVPTISINETDNKKLLIRLNYIQQDFGGMSGASSLSVLSPVISYDSNAGFTRKLMRVSYRDKGKAGVDLLRNPIFSINDDIHYFEFSLGGEGVFSTETESTTVYNYVDERKYLKTLRNINGLSFESSCFLKKSFRYIGYIKSMKALVIKKIVIK